MNDPISLLFDDYFAAGDHLFIKCMKDKQDEYFDNQAQMQNIVHEGLMAMAMEKFNYLVKRKKWGQKSMKDEKIMALHAEVAGLKEELKLAKNAADKAKNGNKKCQEKKEEKGQQEVQKR